MKKRALSLLLVLCLVAGMVPAVSAASVVSSGTCGENLTWVLYDEGTLTISGTGEMWDYGSDIPWDDNNDSIQSVIIENGVTSIGDYAFYYCDILTSVTIPNSVTSIGVEAFRYCKSLTSVTIPKSVTSIGGFAFRQCKSLTGIWVDENNPSYSNDAAGVLFNKDQTILIKAPDAINGNYAIPNSVASIGLEAFYSCESLTRVTIPSSVTFIGESAFGSCNSLTTVAIPSSVTTIADSAFLGCNNLTVVYYTGTEAQWNKMNIGSYNSDLTYATICFEAAEVGDSGTCGDNLTWVLDNKGTLTISGTGAMTNYEDECSPWYCDRSIYSIIIDDGVTSIGPVAFYGCENLTSVTIPNSVTSIGDYAFCCCDSLSTVAIPNSVTSIGSNAFSFCDSLTGIWVNEKNPSYSSDDAGVLFNKDQTILIQAPSEIRGTYAIPNSVISIDDQAFSGCDCLSSVTIPNSVTSIGDYAFEFYDSLTGIWVDVNNPSYSNDASGVLFNKDQTILIQAPSEISGAYAIPSSVTAIGEEAFGFCESLTSVTIPNSVTSIGDAAFLNSLSLTDVYYTGTEAQWNEIDIDSYNERLTHATIHYEEEDPNAPAYNAHSFEDTMDDIAIIIYNLLTKHFTFLRQLLLS